MQQSEKEIEEEWQIIKRAKKHPEAFGFLYEKYYEAIFLFVERRVGDTELAGDLTSQVFLKAMLQLNKYKFKGLPFSAWLYRVASNQVNEHYRKTKRHRIISLESSHYDSLIATAEEWGEKLQDKDPVEVIKKLLSSLNESEVELLELRFFEERPFKEVAFILGITENNAKVRSYRIIEKLKRGVAR